MANVKLKADSINLLQSVDGSKNFLKRCGDKFIRSYVSGGEFIAILQIDAMDEAHKQEIQASLKGSYGALNGSVSFSKSLEEVISNNTTHLYLYQSGGIAKEIKLSVEDLIRQATDFPNNISPDTSVPILANAVDYALVDNFPQNASSLELKAQSELLDNLAKNDLDIGDQLRSVEYVLSHQDEYEFIDLGALNYSANSQRDTLNIIRRAASTCQYDYTSCVMPTYTVPQTTIPPHRKARSPAQTEPSCYNHRATAHCEWYLPVIGHTDWWTLIKQSAVNDTQSTSNEKFFERATAHCKWLLIEGVKNPESWQAIDRSANNDCK